MIIVRLTWAKAQWIKFLTLLAPALIRLGLIKPTPVLGFSPGNDIFTGQQ